MDIVKGREYTINKRFSYRGSAAIFSVAPVWAIYNSNDKMIQSGSTSPSGSTWEVSFTIPTNYLVPDGREKLILQLTGVDNNNKEYIIDQELDLIDEDERFNPVGVVYNAVSDTAINDAIVSSAATLVSYSIVVIDPLGKNVLDSPITGSNVAASSTSSKGNSFKFTIPPLGIEKNIYNDPYQIVIEYNDGISTEVEIHTLYIADRRTINFIQQLNLFLDKSRLVEIDESLQWYTPELIDSLLQGIKRINASEPENTFWTLKDIPSTLDNYTLTAAKIAALDMRLMAEGMNAFEFSGLNTSLNYNRSDFLQSRIGELNSLMDRLPASKKSAINVAGKGTPPVGETDIRRKNIAALGLSVNTLNNKVAARPFRFR
jgi:hypothetical protein